MTKEAGDLLDHVIICGFGQFGRTLARYLQEGGERFVVIEAGKSRVEQAAALGYLAVHGEADEAATLLEGGCRRACAIAAVLQTEVENVFITFVAKALNPSLRVIARADTAVMTRKLIQAGADEVVSDASAATTRIVEMLQTRHHGTDLIEADQITSSRATTGLRTARQSD